MKIFITIPELQEMDTAEIVEALEYVEAEVERAQENGDGLCPEYRFDCCTVEVHDASQ